MDNLYTEDKLLELINEKKTIDNLSGISCKTKNGHKEYDIYIKGENRNKYWLIIRQNLNNSLDFSVIVAFRPLVMKKRLRIRRYNGKHEHTNRLERHRFDDFHIHKATERYQIAGIREDGYAEPTNRFSDVYGAINCALEDCNFSILDALKNQLFVELQICP